MTPDRKFPNTCVITSSGHKIASICNKIFFPLVGFKPSEPFALTFEHGSDEIVQFRCMLGDGGVLAHYRSEKFSYVSSDTKWKLRYIVPQQREMSGYFHLTNGHFERMFELIFTE